MIHQLYIDYFNANVHVADLYEKDTRDSWDDVDQQVKESFSAPSMSPAQLTHSPIRHYATNLPNLPQEDKGGTEELSKIVYSSLPQICFYHLLHSRHPKMSASKVDELVTVIFSTRSSSRISSLPTFFSRAVHYELTGSEGPTAYRVALVANGGLSLWPEEIILQDLPFLKEFIDHGDITKEEVFLKLRTCLKGREILSGLVNDNNSAAWSKAFTGYVIQNQRLDQYDRIILDFIRGNCSKYDQFFSTLLPPNFSESDILSTLTLFLRGEEEERAFWVKEWGKFRAATTTRPCTVYPSANATFYLIDLMNCHKESLGLTSEEIRPSQPYNRRPTGSSHSSQSVVAAPEQSEASVVAAPAQSEPYPYDGTI